MMDSNKSGDVVQEADEAESKAKPKAGKTAAKTKAAPKRARAAAAPSRRPPLPTATTAVPPPPGARARVDEDDEDDDTDGDSASGSELKKQELIGKVMERADVRKKYAKPVVEAVIEILGEALAEGREMNLQPFGKLKVNRAKDTGNARIIVAKIRQAKGGNDGGDRVKEAVAEDED